MHAQRRNDFAERLALAFIEAGRQLRQGLLALEAFIDRVSGHMEEKRHAEIEAADDHQRAERKAYESVRG